jgi:arylsulfatase A-like enzyme
MKLHRKSFFVALVLAPFALFHACNSGAGNKGDTPKPNFIFILVDDLGKEWISATGADSIRTPFIDQLAETGIEFTNAWSMPQCTPSRVALLTGTYPYNNGWINHYDVPRWGHGARFDPGKNITFANVLQEAGYRTCAAGKWLINDFRVEPEAMVNAGFESYCMWTGGEGANEEVSGKRYWDPYIHTKEGSRVYPGEFGPDIFTDFIIGFMKEHRDEPMMIYYPMVLTHGPLVHTPLEPDASTKMEKHMAMVRYTDFLVERLVKELERLNLRENTYLIFTTDNGTAGSIIGSRNGIPTRGGKTYLTENGVNAPFVVNAPGMIPEGLSTDALIDFTDLFPTLADLAGVELPADSQLDGISFVSVLEQGGGGEREWILAMGSLAGRVGDDGLIRNWHHFRDRAIRGKRFKVYVDTLQQINRLFDLENDPLELHNLVDDPGMEEVLNRFELVVQDLPGEDQHPDYVRLDTSYYDVDPQFLVKNHLKDLKRSNMSPPVLSQ